MGGQQPVVREVEFRAQERTGLYKLRLRHVTGGPFVRLAHVHHDQRLATFLVPTLADLAHSEPSTAFNREDGRLPGVHASLVVARPNVLNDTDELADRSLLVIG